MPDPRMTRDRGTDGRGARTRALTPAEDRLMAAVYEPAVRLTAHMPTKRLLETARSLQSILDEHRLGPRTRKVILERQIELFEEVEDRIDRAPSDDDDMPIVEGITWQPGGPLAGSVIDVEPFGHLDEWVAELARIEIPPDRPQRRRKKKKQKRTRDPAEDEMEARGLEEPERVPSGLPRPPELGEGVPDPDVVDTKRIQRMQAILTILDQFKVLPKPVDAIFTMIQYWLSLEVGRRLQLGGARFVAVEETLKEILVISSRRDPPDQFATDRIVERISSPGRRARRPDDIVGQERYGGASGQEKSRVLRQMSRDVIEGFNGYLRSGRTFWRNHPRSEEVPWPPVRKKLHERIVELIKKQLLPEVRAGRRRFGRAVEPSSEQKTSFADPPSEWIPWPP